MLWRMNFIPKAQAHGDQPDVPRYGGTLTHKILETKWVDRHTFHLFHFMLQPAIMMTLVILTVTATVEEIYASGEWGSSWHATVGGKPSERSDLFYIGNFYLLLAIENLTLPLVETIAKLLKSENHISKCKNNSSSGEDASASKSRFCVAWRRRILVNSASRLSTNSASSPILAFSPILHHLYLPWSNKLLFPPFPLFSFFVFRMTSKDKIPSKMEVAPPPLWAF